MKTGKLSEASLKRSVLKQLHSRNDRVILGPEYGADTCVIGVEADEVQVMSINSVMSSGAYAGALAVHAALNDVAASAARPIGVLCSILLPTDCDENALRALIKELDGACASVGAQILGGHTEVTRAVKEVLITATGVGAAKKDACPIAGAIKPGMDLVMTGCAGLEGTVILAREREEELRTRYSGPFLDRTQEYLSQISAVAAANVGAQNGACAMHNASQGGVFGALWELAERGSVGLTIDLKKIQIRQETVEICEFFGINPYKLRSQGVLFMASEDGNGLVSALKAKGIAATLVGTTTDGNDRILLCDGERRFLETAQSDDMLRITK